MYSSLAGAAWPSFFFTQPTSATRSACNGIARCSEPGDDAVNDGSSTAPRSGVICIAPSCPVSSVCSSDPKEAPRFQPQATCNQLESRVSRRRRSTLRGRSDPVAGYGPGASPRGKRQLDRVAGSDGWIWLGALDQAG